MSFGIRSIASGLAQPFARPTAGAAPRISGTTTVGQILTCHHGVWTGGGAVTFAYQWFNSASGSLVGNGANTATYTLQATDASPDTIRCRVTATDSKYGTTVVWTASTPPITP